MKCKIGIDIDENAINEYINSEIKKQTKIVIKDYVKHAVNEYIHSDECSAQLDDLFEDRFTTEIALYAGRKVNMLFQDLEDQLFEKSKKIGEITLNYDISKEEKAFYEGLYVAFLANASFFNEKIWNEKLQEEFLESISDKIFEDIKHGTGYKLLAYRLTKSYERHQKEKTE